MAQAPRVPVTGVFQRDDLRAARRKHGDMAEPPRRPLTAEDLRARKQADGDQKHPKS